MPTALVVGWSMIVCLFVLTGVGYFMIILRISTSLWAQWEMIFGPPLNWTLLLPLADLTSRQKLHTTCLPRQNWLKYFLNCQILAHKISSKQINKKFRMLLVKNCLLSSYSKVYQWLYNEAMRFVLWVAQKILRWPIQFSSTYIVYTYDIQTDVW